MQGLEVKSQGGGGGGSGSGSLVALLVTAARQVKAIDNCCCNCRYSSKWCTAGWHVNANVPSTYMYRAAGAAEWMYVWPATCGLDHGQRCYGLDEQWHS